MDPHVWIKYLDFLDSEGLKGESMAVYARAVRNVPYSAQVWLKYLRALEKAGEPKPEYMAGL